jgi:hypothetical protein
MKCVKGPQILNLRHECNLRAYEVCPSTNAELAAVTHTPNQLMCVPFSEVVRIEVAW